MIDYALDTPWGRWEVLFESSVCKIKRIIVAPGNRLSYQKHFRRSETWVVVEGVATVTLDGKVTDFFPGDVVKIPCEMAHRVGNFGSVQLVFIEVQRGDYFGEDDIVRLEDDYGRAS
ncbi:cupin domain-containing protein [bacterium]|nr:cupin domain-containing protein [bacterium]